jgi:hypothetical protein
MMLKLGELSVWKSSDQNLLPSEKLSPAAEPIAGWPIVFFRLNIPPGAHASAAGDDGGRDGDRLSLKRWPTAFFKVIA